MASMCRPSIAIGLLFGALGCASDPGPFVWAEKYVQDDPSPTAYTASPGDVLSVDVWDNDKLSTKALVRSDGRITMPLLGDVEVEGKTTEQIARGLENQLRTSKLVLNPRVTVQVDEVKPITVAVLGNVVRSGTYPLGPNAGVAEALASAGGLTEFAHKDQIYVLRHTPEEVRIRFTFQSLTGQTRGAVQFRLRNGDVVVAE